MAEKKVLLIDDDLELCEEMAEALKHEGFVPEITGDPTRGIELLMKNKYDAVILDYKMMGLTGVDVLIKLKQAGIRPNVVMISGRPFIEGMLEENGVRDMVVAVMSKPVDLAGLLECLRS